MKTFIDTNILYYNFSKTQMSRDILDSSITSINALEFLKNIEKKHNNKAQYYIPRLNSHLQRIMLLSSGIIRRDHPIKKEQSDSITFDFKQDYDSYALYNNETITQIINNQDSFAFKSSTQFLQKDEFKELNNRFSFILENRLSCESINTNDIELGYYLLDLFLKEHSIKDDFRNSWNDILILAKCANEGGTLISCDKVLNRFASNVLSGSIDDRKDFIELHFPTKLEIESTSSKRVESKGYINRGWQYKLRNAR